MCLSYIAKTDVLTLRQGSCDFTVINDVAYCLPDKHVYYKAVFLLK